MNARPIRLDLNANIAEIVLDRPDKRNALSIEMWAAIPDLVAEAVSADSVKVVLLHGGTADAFAAGADISEFSTIYATPESAAASGQTIAKALMALETCPKPVIAAIEGACIGGGVSLAMAADLRVASERARFGVTPGKLGIVYPPGDMRRLVQIVGTSRARDMLFTGRIFPASEAMDMGMLNRLVPEGTALNAARTLAEDISGISQWSARATKTMLAGFEAGWTDETPEAVALFQESFANEDFEEGYRAFLEKRPAKFTFV